MFKNYLKISLRHAKKNKGFSLINIFGLSLGMTCAILILLWVQDEVTYNRFHEKYTTLYQVMDNQTYEGKTYTFSAVPGLLAGALKDEVPEIKNTARADWGNRWLFTLGEKTIYDDGRLVDPSYLDMFTFPMLYGEKKNALADGHSIILTNKLSQKLFGDENPVGKYIKVNNRREVLITGVLKDPPNNSSLKFQWLASFKIFEKNNDWYKQWDNNGMQTYVELKPGADVDKLNKKIYSFIQTKNKDAAAKIFLHSMDDWRLRSKFNEGKQDGGRIEYVRLFSIIALFLIFIACINFMNLATARSEQRMREVGVRKVMGAERFALMKQFVGESLVTSCIALIIACVFVLISLPFFNELVEKKLSLGLTNPLQWLLLIGIALFCGFIAGSYPSVYLSSFSPVSIFKGMQIKSSGAAMVRKGLVVTQFVVSIVLIISTVVIFRQIQHVKDRQLGYNKENLIYCDLQANVKEHFDVIRQNLISTGMVTNAATSSQNLLSEGSNTGGFSWEGKDPTKEVLITVENGSPGFINTTGMQIIAGRDFNADWKKDSMNIIINEAFAKLMNKKNPVGEIVRQDSNTYHIVGLVKDFVYNDFYKAPDPYVLYCDPRNTYNLFIRIKDNANTSDALAKIESVIKKNNPGYPFEYNFIDADFDRLFKSEMLVAKLSRLFAILTIFISCLGLFGLAAYTAERRTKEIGIRKVLGATVANMVSLLSKDFLKLVFVAVLVASPLAWYIMNNWLQDYAYRINIQWWIFVMAAFLALLIAFLTVSIQAIKAAIANPVNSLRTE
ncbi:MAG TPA: ABC transporter permease [Bacteroidia bacterium]|nr:ABC transporter permease [Bacteroidia bacterium]